MSKNKKYRIMQKDFRKLEKLAERIYNTVTVIDYFCRTQQEIEELYNLTPIVENLRRDNMCGWARNVYLFGCSFIHLSACHNYMQEDPFLKLSLKEHNAIKNVMVQYHNFPKEQDINFIIMQPYLLKIFKKISDNLKCHLENLNKNPSETNIM